MFIVKYIVGVALLNVAFVLIILPYFLVVLLVSGLLKLFGQTYFSDIDITILAIVCLFLSVPVYKFLEDIGAKKIVEKVINLMERLG